MKIECVVWLSAQVKSVQKPKIVSCKWETSFVAANRTLRCKKLRLMTDHVAIIIILSRPTDLIWKVCWPKQHKIELVWSYMNA